MIPLRSLATLLFLTALSGLAAACIDFERSPLPDSLAQSLKTPDGSEVDIVCPPSISDLLETADPAALSTALAEFNIRTPVPPEGLFPPGALTPAPNTLYNLVPPESPFGPVHCCIEGSNESFGTPFGGGGIFGFGATQEQLEQMGRLCGVLASGAMEMRVDLYATAPGAMEAYRREAQTMSPDDLRENVKPEDEVLLASIGDERALTHVFTVVNGQRLDKDEYDLLFRRRNIIARIELGYAGQGPPEPLLGYAAQVDRNVEAAVRQQSD
jgi:hypothetical protein